MSADAIVRDLDAPLEVWVDCYHCGERLAIGRPVRHRCNTERDTVRLSIEWSENVEDM